MRKLLPALPGSAARPAKRGVSRRLVGLALALSLFSVACTDRVPASADPDRLVVAVSTLGDSTFLPWNGSSGRKIYLDTIYDYLVYIDPESGDLTPGLAKRWEVSADGKVQTLWLRPGIQFQQGWGEVTAEDVKFSVERIIAPDAIAGPSSWLRANIEEVRVPSRYRVEIVTRAPYPDFIRGYLSNGLGVAIVSKHYVETVGEETANASPVGTGAYELTGFKKDVSIELAMREDAENLWRVDPDFRKLEFISAPEEFTRVAMLKTGEADIAAINFDSINFVEEEGINIIYIKSNWSPVIRLGGLTPMYPNPDVPWADRRVRLAMNYAVNKKELIETIFHGQGTAAGSDTATQGLMDIDPFPYDPDRARQLLAEAGYADGFDIQIKTYTTNPGAELPVVAQIVALYWRDVGIRATIEPTNWVGLRSAWTTGNARDVAWTHRGYPMTMALVVFHSGNSPKSVFASFSNDRVGEYLDRIGATLDPEERSRLSTEFGRYLRDEGANVYIGHVDEPYGVSDKVGAWPTIREHVTNIDSVRRRGSG